MTKNLPLTGQYFLGSGQFGGIDEFLSPLFSVEAFPSLKFRHTLAGQLPPVLEIFIGVSGVCGGLAVKAQVVLKQYPSMQKIVPAKNSGQVGNIALAGSS